MSGRGSGNTICNNANCTTRRQLRRSVVIALGKWLHKQQQQPLKPQQRRLTPQTSWQRETVSRRQRSRFCFGSARSSRRSSSRGGAALTAATLTVNCCSSCFLCHCAAAAAWKQLLKCLSFFAQSQYKIPIRLSDSRLDTDLLSFCKAQCEQSFIYSSFNYVLSFCLNEILLASLLPLPLLLLRGLRAELRLRLSLCSHWEQFQLKMCSRNFQSSPHIQIPLAQTHTHWNSPTVGRIGRVFAET